MSKKERVVWTLENHCMIQCNETIISEVKHETNWVGDNGTFIVTNLMNVYRSHQITNLLTGKLEDLWLTKEQIENFNRNNHELIKVEIHPRSFELAKIGIKTVSAGSQKLEGFSDGSSFCLTFDKEGHIWHGHFDISPPRAYLHQFKPPRGKNNLWKPPELRFVRPYLTYLGPDEPEVWMPSRRGSKKRLAIHNDDVRQVIEKHGMIGRYFPQGAARTQPALAEKQMKKLKANTLIELEAALKGKMDGIKTELDIAQQNLIQEKKDHGQTQGELRKHVSEGLKAKDGTDRLKAEIENLKEQVTDLEDDLQVARSKTGCGFGLDCV